MEEIVSSYHNQEFSKPLFIKKQKFSGSLEFMNCTFKSTVIISKVNVEYALYFEDCIFENSLTLENVESTYLTFLNCKTDSQIRLKSCKGEDLSLNKIEGRGSNLFLNGQFTYIHFQNSNLKSLSIQDLNPQFLSLESRLELRNCEISALDIKAPSLYSNLNLKSGKYDSISLIGIFHNSILFSENIEVNELFIESSTLKGRLDFREGEFQYIYIYRSIFYGLVIINNYSEFIKNKKDLVTTEITIHSNTFEQNINLSQLKIETLNLSNNNFKQIFSFDSPIQEENPIHINLDGTNSGNLVFEEFHGDVDLKCINFGYIYFKNVELMMLIIKEFQNNGLLSFSKIKGSKLSTYLIIEDSNIGRTEFIDTDFKKFSEIVFANSILEKATFSTYPFNVKSSNKNKRIGFGISKKENNKNLANIYKQLKQVAMSNRDIDTASKYQSLEYKYLMRNKSFYPWDKVLLFLNYISNSNGYNWTRGIFFTFVISIISFVIYGYFVGMKWEFNSLLENYVSFFTSFPKLQLDSYNNETIPAQISIWVSRLFIGYGIYQTIAAFRKYGKTT